MSVFVTCMVAVCGVLTAISIVMLERLKREIRRRPLLENSPREPANDSKPRLARQTSDANAAAPIATSDAESRQAASQLKTTLDRWSDELDRDTAEWESLLREIPQTLTDSSNAEPLQDQPASRRIPVESMTSPQDNVAPVPSRTRSISADERGQIQRLFNSEFAPEEIALWLNLPLERVQEILWRP